MKTLFRSVLRAVVGVGAIVGPFAFGCDSDPSSSAKPNADITFETLAAAREKLLAGAKVVDLNTDGSVKYHHDVDATAGTDTEELDVAKRPVLRWVHTGDLGHLEQDTDGDGTFDWQLDAVGGPLPTDRKVVITSEPAADGSPTRRETITQASDTDAHVTVESGADGAWTVVDDYDTTVLQELGGDGGITHERLHGRAGEVGEIDRRGG